MKKESAGGRSYQKEMEQILNRHESRGEVPALLLHSCCAPCSSYVLEYLSQYFRITVLYYNPNIYPESEYIHRVKEQKRFIQELPMKHPAALIEGDYESGRFYQMAEGMEDLPEGGERCFACYELRLKKTAEYAAQLGMDYFTTTLSISPRKNARRLNEIGGCLAQEYGVPYLYSDFKKKNGYLRSIQLSKEYGMYRQDYCGCVFSKREREAAQKQEEHPKKEKQE